MQQRQIVLDTETTGLETAAGHRLIEIGGVELSNRRLTGRHFHQYLQPDREIDPGAFQVHGISNEFLADKPRFQAIVDEFIEFIRGAELIIHNAAFDVGFIDHELSLLGRPERVAALCQVCDTLALARDRHPGQRNNLDALCKRYGIDNGHRDLHGALLDAEILADVYLAMTGGQVGLSLDASVGENGAESDGATATGRSAIRRLADPQTRPPLPVLKANTAEQEAHQRYLALLAKKAGRCVWTERTSQ